MKTKLQVSSSDYKKLSDEELVHRFTHRHENNAVNHLFERYGHLVFGICMKYMSAEKAKQATQALFIDLLTDLKKSHIEHFKSWLFHHTNNYCLAQTTNPIPAEGNTLVHDSITDYTSDQTIPVLEFQTDLLENLMAELNKDERTCINMFYDQQMSYAQISAATGFSLSQVRYLLHSGKQLLRNKIEASAHVQK